MAVLDALSPEPGAENHSEGYKAEECCPGGDLGEPLRGN